MSSTDSISRSVTIKAPRSRVWRALTDAKEFSKWFGVAIETPFEAGKPAYGVITMKGLAGMRFELAVESSNPRVVLLVAVAPVRD